MLQERVQGGGLIGTSYQPHAMCKKMWKGVQWYVHC